jgi:hypothetical protein
VLEVVIVVFPYLPRIPSGLARLHPGFLSSAVKPPFPEKRIDVHVYEVLSNSTMTPSS